MSDEPGDHPVVLISDRQQPTVNGSDLAELAVRCLEGEGVGPDAELSVSFVSAEEITDLHQRYMGEEGPTDVLSFRMDEDGVVDEGGMRVLGDVVIAPSIAAQNNSDVEGELRLLLVHGILHLLGHDHEDEQERSSMWERQSRYVETMPS
jgi:probable rRNA maturation factor